MHGYEMIQEIAERTQNLWRPSPGSVYPTLQLLVDEGLIAGTESEGSKKLFELTDDGRAAAEKIETPPWEEIAEGLKNEEPGHVNLRSAVAQLVGAVAQSAYTANEEQQGTASSTSSTMPAARSTESSASPTDPTIRGAWAAVSAAQAFQVLLWLHANLFARAVHCRPRRFRRHAATRPRRVRAAAGP
jgi:DNA-binding PadR family transcriptional regulator